MSDVDTGIMHRMAARMIKSIVALVIYTGSFTLPLVAIAQEESKASIAYDQAVEKYAKPRIIKFRDDPTDVSGKAYDLAKATLSWFGVVGNVIDAADFARSVKNEGINSVNIATYLSKIAVGNISNQRLSDYLNKMEDKDVIKLLSKHGIVDPDVNNYQRYLLDYISETGPKALAEDDSSKAYEGILIDVVTKVCPPCDVAHKSFELAKESAKAAELFFDNKLTQELFEHMDKDMQVDQQIDFIREFSKNRNWTDEAEKALSLYHKSANLPSPTYDEVLSYIFKRYERWQAERQVLQDEAEMLKQVKAEYLRLDYYDRKILFGQGDEELWADKFMSTYTNLYNQVISQKEEGFWTLECGRESVRVEVFHLLQKYFRNKLTSEQLAYEKKIVAAKCRWISDNEVGESPYKKEKVSSLIKPIQKNCASEKTIEDKRKCKIMNRLIAFNHTKFLKVLNTLKVKSSKSFLNCLCSNAGYGSSSTAQFYHPDTLGKYNKRYTCNQPGEPCVVSGLGCSRHPLPSNFVIWERCMKRYKVNTKTTSDGKVEPRSGVQLDEYIEKVLRQRITK